MKKLIYLFAGLLIISSSCEKPVDRGEAGNPLIRFYGDAKDDIGYSIAETTGGYVICGKLTVIERGVNDAGSTAIVDEDPQFGLIKTRRDGIQEWVYYAGGEGFDEGKKVIALPDGSFICAGTATVTTGNKTHRDILVTKISSSGQMIWEKYYGDEQNQTGEYFNQECYDLIRSYSGTGYLVVGSDNDDTRGNNPGNRNMYLLSIDNDGEYIDSYSPGSEGDEYAKSVSTTPSGNFIAVGTTNFSTTDTPGQDGMNIMTYVFSFTNLNQTNYKVYGGSEDEYVTDVVESVAGNAIVGTREFGLDSKKGIFVDLEVYGTILPLTLEFSEFDLESNVLEILSIIRIPEGGYIAAGNTGGTELSGDMFFMFLDDLGNNVSSPKTFKTGGTGLQSVNEAIIDSEGKVVAVGINSYENNSLITLLKFDPWE
jgi:hypothetical protein